MIFIMWTRLLLCWWIPAAGVAQLYTQPEQIHLSYGSSPTDMVVTWVTQNITSVSVVEYGTHDLGLKAKGSNATLFTDGGPLKRSMWIHRVTLQNLQPGSKYMYHVGSPQGWSTLLGFRAMKAGVAWSPRLAVFGDMGNEDAIALPALQEEAINGRIDAILHVGDFAYDLDTDNARVGDAFMNQIQPIAAYIPYMVCAGNHEHAYNFSNYKNRFTMPGGDGENTYYSFNLGRAHIIAFSTEVYYYYSYEEYGWLPMVNQYRWLEQDLKEANRPENRSLRPWIITVGHKPMYCSNNDKPDEQCNNLHNNRVRYGIPDLRVLGLEELFYQQGVDLQFYAHEHSYERLWPVYNMTVCNGSTSPYEDPPAPVHIVTGSAGNNEGQTRFNDVPYPWSAYHTDDFGYTHLTIVNATHLHLEQVSVKKNGEVVDKVTVVKNRHGPGVYSCPPH